MSRNLTVSPARIAADIDALAAITDAGRPWTRRAFSDLFLQGRAYLEKQFRAAGLETHIDTAGNLIGRRAGRNAKAGTIMLGSHSDTVPDGGRFDGVAGVVVALEVARGLKEAGIELEHNLEVTDFLAEEVSIFGVSCVGSRGMAGIRPDEWLGREAEGMTLAEGIEKVGGKPALQIARDDIRAFLELHIEQGPVLEGEKLDIGVVTAIAGITRVEIIVEGRADHAGTTPMDRRADALAAAAHVVLAVETLAGELAATPGHFAATTGEFEMWPNAANVVPSKVRMLLDIRSEHRDDLGEFLTGLESCLEGIARDNGVAIAAPRLVSDNPAMPMDPLVMETLDAACETTGAAHRRMASGAGHDAAFMARIARAGMIFIPCLSGRSHAPEEWAENADIALGAEVLFEAVKRLDKQLMEQ
ncbi:Zn-dependent hydrolase [Martelella lutilitoris]|uniref:Zn-dependent hydrolase n=1 Tax=Martelella lutilitoris TaxID=2583532 RepID=A0A7T7KLA8_9HYPH|nr:Zn-dependent hydrolase [Martelella lutilitoris]QQM30531.1 Zn-dependent hydrolase [Martelella lutilitoris]